MEQPSRRRSRRTEQVQDSSPVQTEERDYIQGEEKVEHLNNSGVHYKQLPSGDWLTIRDGLDA